MIINLPTCYFTIFCFIVRNFFCFLFYRLGRQLDNRKALVLVRKHQLALIWFNCLNADFVFVVKQSCIWLTSICGFCAIKFMISHPASTILNILMIAHTIPIYATTCNAAAQVTDKRHQMKFLIRDALLMQEPQKKKLIERELLSFRIHGVAA